MAGTPTGATGLAPVQAAVLPDGLGGTGVGQGRACQGQQEEDDSDELKHTHSFSTVISHIRSAPVRAWRNPPPTAWVVMNISIP